MTQLTPQGADALAAIAARHGVSFDAALHMVIAVSNGGGTMAQFSHPELGGMGQWSMGGMIMVGDMFNHGLKARVDALCNDLSALLRGPSPFAPPPQGQGGGQNGGWGGGWWPVELDLGQPASSGSQNAMRYAYFPQARRLAVDAGGAVMVYDTGEHQIGGFGQQQGSDPSITLSSQFGTIRLSDLAVVWPAPQAPAAAPQPVAPESPAGDVFAALEKLGALRDRGVLSDAEFSAKKAELLARL